MGQYACVDDLTHGASPMTVLYFTLPQLFHAVALGRSGLSVDCDAGQAKGIADGLSRTLGSREMEETQVLFIRGNIQPKLEDFSDIAPLKKFLNRTQSDWLIDMMKENRFTSHFQPGSFHSRFGQRV